MFNAYEGGIILARELVFEFNGNEYSFEPVKVERKKLYGWTETIALDDDGNECKLVSMDESGTVIIPKGGVGLGMVNKAFEWVERSELIAVDRAGNEVQPLPSSFSVHIELEDTASLEEFLDHGIALIYELDGAYKSPELLKEASEKIFKFTFNYREGYEGNPAFLIGNGEKLFILVGVLFKFDFVGLDEAGFLDENEDDEEFSEELGIDFSMM